MSFDFVRKMSLRRQILWGTQLFTAVVSLLVGVVLFALSDSYIRTTTLRSVEFNLQQMSASVQTDLDTARSLLNWASTDSTPAPLPHRRPDERPFDHLGLRDVFGPVSVQPAADPDRPLFRHQRGKTASCSRAA